MVGQMLHNSTKQFDAFNKRTAFKFNKLFIYLTEQLF